MSRKQIDPNIKCSPEIEKLLDTFKPKFGNERHLQILKLYNDIRKIISLKGAANKDVAYKESTLLWMLKQNQDATKNTNG